MPSAQNPVPNRSEKARTGIYIARGVDTLGPYDPDEAAALVVGGYLHTDDHAARNGDTVWVPLIDLLPPSFRDRPALTSTRPAPTAPRWRRLVAATAGLVAAALLIVAGSRWYEARRELRPAAAQPTPTPAPAATPAPTPASVAPVVETPPTIPPTPEPDGPLHGSLDVPVAGVRITAYPLDALEAALEPAAEDALFARQRLDPQIKAAAAELATRTAEEQAALRALNEASPSDPMLHSLRFAYSGAKTATRTAADNHRFVLEERAAAAGGEIFFRVLPAPTLTTETGADGTFVLALPPDGQPYAVAASAQEKTGDDTVRTRRWLVRLTAPQRTGHVPLRLDDANALTSTSEDSLVHAPD